MNQKLKSIIRLVLFNTLGRFHFRIKKENDLVILTSSRSGSTWFVESLLKYNRFMTYNQPFDNLLNVNLYAHLLPLKGNPFLINLTKDETEAVMYFFHQLRLGKIFNNVNWRVWDKFNYIFYKRKLFKVFFAKDIFKLFVSEKNIDIIYLTRHPITRAFSNIQYGYPHGCQYLFDNEKLMNIIGQEKIESLKQIFSYSGELEKHVLGWFLENYNILNYVEKNNSKILHIKYEDMIEKPKIISEKLSQCLEIKKENINFSNQPSSTTHKDQLLTLDKRRKKSKSIYDLNSLSESEANNIIQIFEFFPQNSYSIIY